MSKYIFECIVDNKNLKDSDRMKVLRIEVCESANINDMMKNFKSFLLGCGFNKENIDEYIPDE